MNSPPRVAFLTDTYHETNGVALTSRQLQNCAQQRGYPFLCVYGGEDDRLEQSGSVTHVQLRRGPLAFHLDKGLRQDPALGRHMRELTTRIVDFGADLIHITSPGDVGKMGAAIARERKLPLVISWHTNFHEFGAQRLQRWLSWLPAGIRDPICQRTEHHILRAMIRFYKRGRVLFAPNDDLVAMLEQETGRPVFLMKRGIDAALFNPAKRTVHDGIFRLGYVGRVTPEKSVRFLADLERALNNIGLRNFRFLIVGDGSEQDWLKRNLKAADLPGVLCGNALAEAYANMDLFVFPSKTDTFGNVILEAMASGAPCVVTDRGGPKFIIREGATGFAAASDEAFIGRVAEIMTDPGLHGRMRVAARTLAVESSWDAVFDDVYAGYGFALERAATRSSEPVQIC